MTKRQREAAEKAMLKDILDKNPKLKTMIDAMIDNPNPELQDAVKPILEEKLSEQRMIGIAIGWQAALLRLPANIKKFNLDTVDKVVAYCEHEAELVKDRLKLKYGTIEDIEGAIENEGQAPD